MFTFNDMYKVIFHAKHFHKPIFWKNREKTLFLAYIHIFKENGLSEVHQIENS